MRARARPGREDGRRGRAGTGDDARYGQARDVAVDGLPLVGVLGVLEEGAHDVDDGLMPDILVLAVEQRLARSLAPCTFARGGHWRESAVQCYY